MRSLICTASVMCLLVVAGVMSRGASDETPATIEKIMDTLHKGKKSTLAALKTALKSPSPDWAAVQKETKTYSKFAADLPKNDPPKGDPAAFKTLAKAFAANAKTLNDAAEKEDLAAANAALRKLVGSCNSCHDAPQGRLTDPSTAGPPAMVRRAPCRWMRNLRWTLPLACCNVGLDRPLIPTARSA